ncbi:MAG: type II toxin-antitoxin system PemK/MazF family toxin [Chthoniobacter sp.]|uniref:type II toxin-antitoxin system PemK/MazF family toxin n=1 Tax=Chthoniobacter sp. TaxID=2510640 RepID=UPI0032AC9566
MARPSVERGEVWLVDLGMAQKVRPAVILSVAYLDHERALVTYVPRTTSVRQTRFEVPHSAPGFAPGAFDVQSIGTMPGAKLIRRIAKLDLNTLAKVEDAVRAWLPL